MFVRKDSAHVIKMLEKQIADLEDEKQSVKRSTEDSHNYDADQSKMLEEWLKATTDYIQKAHDLVHDVGKHEKSKCLNGLCLNPTSPYQLKKKAEQICKRTATHVQEARGFPIPLSYRQEKVAVDHFQDFESRSGVLEDIMESLRSPCINKIGVYGEAGMGKTMLVREVKRTAEQDRLFDTVVMATVGRNPDLQRIRDEIARVSNEQTGLIEKKVLVILDDVWQSKLNLELVGINGKEEDNVVSYKMLLTSRDGAIVSPLSQTQIEIVKLAREDAWNLFKKIADDPDKSRGMPFYANQIPKKCEKLPIAVATLANALRGRKLIEWKTTLRKLQSLPSNQADSSHTPQSLHLALELHYNGLKGDEQLQQTFLLCSLLGQNATIQNLLKYGIGLGLFPGVESARAQVLNLVTKLRDSSWLLDGDNISYFDVHDLVRDFATSTAFKEHGVLASRDDEPINMEAMESIKWIYLSDEDSSPFSDDLKCPQLTFFHLSKTGRSLASRPNLFRDKEGLKVLSLSQSNFLSIPSSIFLPKNLCTLCLDQVEFGETNIGTMMGELENLQVLSLAGSDIKELPKQMGQLAKLKLLDLSDCTQLKIIPSGVLSCLSNLEELYMRNSFNKWASASAEGIFKAIWSTSRSSLKELQHLKLLTTTELNICSINQIPESLLFSENLVIFKIFMGDRWIYWDGSSGSSKSLKLKLDGRISPYQVRKLLLRKTNELHLEGLTGAENVNELDEGGFPELKYLFVKDALNIQHIISTEAAFPVLEVLVLCKLENMKKICYGQLGTTSFGELRSITIEFCNMLKNLFSSSIARQLQQLQEISVIHCNGIEVIVDDGGDDTERSERDEIVELNSLLFLRLQHLSQLISFNSSCGPGTLFNKKVMFPNIEELQLSSIMVNNTIWNNSMTPYVEKLTKLIVHDCDNLEYLFSSSMVRSLSQLKHIHVKGCKSMRMIIGTENEEQEKLNFSQLNFLLIEDLHNLIGFYSKDCIVEFLSLKQLHILNCLKLEGSVAGSSGTNPKVLFNEKVVFSTNLKELQLCSIDVIHSIWHPSVIASCVGELKKLIVHGCQNLKYLFSSGDSEGRCLPKLKRAKQLRLPKLKRLELGDLPNLNSICHRRTEMACDSLERIIIWNCGQLMRFPLYLPLLDNRQPSAPSSLKQIVVWPRERWESLEWGHPNAKDVLQRFYERESDNRFPFELVEGRIKRMEFTDIVRENIWLLPSVQELVIKGCNNLRSLNDTSAIKDAKELKCCGIYNCQSLEYVLSSSINPLAQKIEVLRLYDLEILQALFEAEAITHSPLPPNPFSSLKIVSVRGCHKIKKLFPFWRHLQNLEEIEIRDCREMKEIIAWDAEEAGGEREGPILPKLKSLTLQSLPTLKSICSRRAVMVCDSLEQITIDSCERLKRIPLYLPLLDNGQPSPPPSLKRIKLRPPEWREKLKWDNRNAWDVLLRLSLIDEEDEE